MGYYILPLIFTGESYMSIDISLGIAFTTCLIEIIIGLLDTPFVYLAKKIKKNNSTGK